MLGIPSVVPIYYDSFGRYLAQGFGMLQNHVGPYDRLLAHVQHQFAHFLYIVYKQLGDALLFHFQFAVLAVSQQSGLVRTNVEVGRGV